MDQHTKDKLSDENADDSDADDGEGVISGGGDDDDDNDDDCEGVVEPVLLFPIEQ